MKNIDVKELITAMEELEKEKGIKKDYLIESLEAALVTAYKRNFDSADNVSVEINQTTGDVHIYSIKKVVDKVIDPLTEISLAAARKIDKKKNLDDEVNVEIAPKDIGRIAA